MAEARGPVFLISGGSGMRKRKGPDPMLQAVIHRTGVRQPTIAYVGTASGRRTMPSGSGLLDCFGMREQVK